MGVNEPLAGRPGTARLVDGTLQLVPRPKIEDPAQLPSPYLAGLVDAQIANGMVWQLTGLPLRLRVLLRRHG